MTALQSEQGREEGARGARRVPLPARATLPFIAGAVFLVGSVLVGLLVGPVHLGVGAVARSAVSHLTFSDVHSPLSDTDEAILWQLRAPRVVLGVLVGGMLALAGGAYQGVFRNPLVDPYLLGVAAGAGLGATLMIAYAPGQAFNGDLLPVAAFAGGALAVVIAYSIGRSARTRASATLVLAGVTVTAFLTSIQTFVQQQHSDTLQAVYSWILGSLDTAGWHDVYLILPYAAVSAVVLVLHRRVLDVMALGDDEASTLGMNVGRTRLLLVVAATIGTAAAVAVAGLIGFIGIIVPHFIRLVAGSSYRIVVPLSLLVGGGFLVLCDVLARTVASPAELPIGVVTAFFGAPFFAVVLRTSRSVGP
jgi:iron complex transport system permease protein